MKSKLLLLIFLIISISCYSQDESWEPQKHITGYIATEGEYFNFKDLKLFDRNYAVSISEVGLLVDYQLLRNLSIKSVFVYRPDFSVDQMLNEASAEYKVADYLKFKIGRFLTPLSPMNTYYYAPVNNSASLPLIISHHEFFPLNMDALSVNGKFGNDVKFDYDVFGGGFRNALWIRTGALGLFGIENNYFQYDSIASASNNTSLSFGEGGHIGAAYQEFVTVGFNVFNSTERVDVSGVAVDVDKVSYGFNLKLKFSTLQLLGEIWKTTVKINSLDFSGVYKSSFVELSNSFGKLTPYFRFDNEDAVGYTYERYTAGLNFKPIFETTFKLEYMLYKQGSTNLNGVVGTVIYSF